MKGLLKIVLAFMGVFLAFIPLDGARATNAVEGTVTIHYQRHNEDYQDWGLWIWATGQGGIAFDFDGESDFGATAEINLDEFELGDGTELGFIVRKGDWEAKDVDHDRFIDLTRLEDGELHVYLLEGNSDVNYSEDEIDLSPTLTFATFESFDEIRLVTSVPVTTLAGIVVTDEAGEELAVETVTLNDNGSLQVILEEAIDMGATYFISKSEFKAPISVSFAGLFDSDVFHELFYYDGDDLGANFTPESTFFRLWAPTASNVMLNLFSEGSGDNLIEQIQMKRDVKGTWIAEVEGNLNLTYYTYDVTVYGVTQEAVDPYARAVGVNGWRGMVIDLDQTRPEGWSLGDRPDFSGNLVDAIIYELHMRDWSTHESSDIENVGQFIQFTEPGATDHLTNLGVTHLHLLPAFSFASIDETRLDEPQFNWGYDPLNYNVPQGSYSTNPHRGEVRVNEFKQMVQALHQDGIRVVMDVVYNHTGPTHDSDFNKIVPGYFYRQDEFGNFSNGSGCGNETASDRAMMRRFIVDSVVYWATQYHIDGFRFDLMALHDIETMNAVREALDAIDPTIIIYGEGWDAGGAALDPELAASKANTSQMPGIAMFNDDLRDGVKGSVFEEADGGFVNGNFGFASRVKFGIVGSVYHPQIDYTQVAAAGGSSAPWATTAAQSVNYVSAHDNHTLFDKLRLTLPDADFETIRSMQKQANAIVLTAQGVPFLHAGVEMMRTKDFDHNSYQSPDEVNQIDWNWLEENQDVFEYHQGLIALRGAHPAFRMSEQADIEAHLSFMEELPHGVIAFHLSDHANGDSVSDIIVIHNATDSNQKIDLPLTGEWNLVVNGDRAGTETLEVIVGHETDVTPHSTFVLLAEDVSELTGNATEAPENGTRVILVLGAVGVLLTIGTFTAFKKKK